MAVISRMETLNPSESEKVDFFNLLRGIKNIHPEVLEEMQVSANQVRSFLRGRGIRLGKWFTFK